MVVQKFAGGAPNALKKGFIETCLCLKAVLHCRIIHFSSGGNLLRGIDKPALTYIGHDGHTGNFMQVIV